MLLQVRTEIDPSEVMKALERAEKMYGKWGVLITLAFIVGLFLLGLFLYFRTKGIAQLDIDKSLAKYQSNLDESVKKSMADYESKLGLELQSKIGVMFRDESIRNDALSHVLKDLYKIRLDIWKKVYASYFEYQKCWNWTLAEFKEIDYKKQYEDLIKLREKVFLHEVQLGEELTFHIIRINTHIRENLTNRVGQIKNPNEAIYQSERLRIEELINNHLEEAKRILKEMFSTNKSIKDFELKAEHLEVLNNERKKGFEGV